MKPLRFCPKPPPNPWLLAAFKYEEPAFIEKLGIPHYVETDSTRTYGGNEAHWYFELESGNRAIVTYQYPYGISHLIGQPGDLPAIIAGLGLTEELTRDKSRFEICNPPRLA